MLTFLTVYNLPVYLQSNDQLLLTEKNIAVNIFNSAHFIHVPAIERTILYNLEGPKEFIIKMEGNTAEFSDISGSEIH
jgi:hypothetical protein